MPPSLLLPAPPPSPAAHLFVCVAFSVALVVSLTAFTWTPNGTKRQVALVISTVNFVSAATYLVRLRRIAARCSAPLAVLVEERRRSSFA